MEKIDENNIFIENQEYIDVLLLLIRRIKISKCDFINEYNFNRNEISNILIERKLEDKIINEMDIYGLFDKKTIEYCKVCGNSLNLCICDEYPNVGEIKDYYIINQEVMINYIISAINYIYKFKLEKKKNEKDYYKDYYNVYSYSEKNISMYILKGKINDEIISKINNGRNIIITLFDSINDIDSYIYNWYDILDSGRVEFFKSKFESYLKNIRSSDSFNFELGDDLDTSDIENIRMVFRKYLIKNGYECTTVEKDYRPEYIDYGLSKEYLRECFVKNDCKIFIKKVKENKLEAVYFKGGIIGNGDENFQFIKKFYDYILNKVQLYRSVKFFESNIDRTNKLIQIVTPIVNIGTLIVAKSNSVQLFNNLKPKIQNLIKFSGLVDIFLIVAIVINIAYVIFIGYYYVLPLINRIFFSWERGIDKI